MDIALAFLQAAQMLGAPGDVGRCWLQYAKICRASGKQPAFCGVCVSEHSTLP